MSFEPTPRHRALARMVGTWSGPTRTWFDASGAPDETTTDAFAEMLLDGRFLRISYRGVAMGKPHEGELLVGFHKDAGEWETTQIDSFHTGTMMMKSVGKADDENVVRVVGSYPAGGEQWGWRTVIRLVDDALVLESFNIHPNGQEDPAIATNLRRVAKASNGE